MHEAKHDPIIPFKSNKTQAVHLPKQVSSPDYVKHVEIVKQGSGLLIVPAGKSWDSFFEAEASATIS